MGMYEEFFHPCSSAGNHLSVYIVLLASAGAGFSGLGEFGNSTFVFVGSCFIFLIQTLAQVMAFEFMCPVCLIIEKHHGLINK